jgi:hypothetical protein
MTAVACSGLFAPNRWTGARRVHMLDTTHSASQDRFGGSRRFAPAPAGPPWRFASPTKKVAPAYRRLTSDRSGSATEGEKRPRPVKRHQELDPLRH